MHVGLLGPITTTPLDHHLPAGHGLPPDGMGGTPIVLLTEELLAQGHDVTVWSLSPDITEPVRADGPHLRMRYLPWRHQDRGKTQYRDERRWLTRAVMAERNDVDVLNAHWTYEYAMACQRIPADRRPPLLVTSHDWAPTILRYQVDGYRLMRMVMAMRVYARRPALTVPSPYLARPIRRVTGLDATVVPNGLSEDKFAGPRRITDVGHRIVSIADGFGDRKNTSTLFRAVALLRRRGHDVHLTVIGHDHGPGEPAEAWARANGVHEGITFAGRQPYERVFAAINESDVMAHPAREESFGMVLIEAMAKGLPVVAGRGSGAVPWVLDNGRAGHLVDIDDPESMADGIQSVLTDPARAEELSEAGYRHAHEHFVMPVVAAGYVEAYERVRTA